LEKVPNFNRTTARVLGYIHAHECQTGSSPIFSEIQRNIDVNINGKDLSKHLSSLIDFGYLVDNVKCEGKRKFRTFSTTEMGRRLVSILPEDLTHLQGQKLRLCSLIRIV